MTATTDTPATYSGAFNFAFVRFSQKLVDAGNITAVQNKPNNDGNNVTITLTGHSEFFSLDQDRSWGLSNRGDYHIRAGGATNDTTRGVFVASIAQNGVDYGFGDGTQYGMASIGYRDDGSIFASLNQAPTGGEFNSNISAANFDFERYVGAWVRNDGTKIVSNASFASKATVTKNSDYTYTVKLNGVDSNKDGILLVTGADNKAIYAAARPLEDGSGWVIGTHGDTTNGYAYDDDDFGFTYIPAGSPDITLGRVMSDGSSSVASGDYTVTKLGVGEYKLTIPGVLPSDGALILSPEGLDGANIDNIVSYQPTAEGDGWIIQTRDIPSMQLEDAGLSAHPDQITGLLDDPDAAYVGAPVEKIIASYEDAGDGNVLIAAHRAGYFENGTRIVAENSLDAIEHSISLGVDIVEVDIRETKDGAFVIMHDDSINRTTTGSGNVRDLTLDYIRAQNLVIEGSREVTDQRVLTIDELFSAIDGRVMVNLDKVEVKDFARIAALGEAAGVASQLLFKTAITNADQLEAVKAALQASPDSIHFMPILYPNTDTALIERIFKELPVNGVEINVYPESSGAVEDPGFFFRADVKALFDEYNVRYFINTLFQGSGNSSGSMSGNRGDFQGMERPDLVYGYWTDKGVSIIQTDEPRIVANYLIDNGLRLPLALDNTAPDVGAPLSLDVTEDGGAATVDLLSHASDAENDALSVVDLDDLPEGVSFDAATHMLGIDPAHAAYQALAAGETRTVSVGYAVSDGQNKVVTAANFIVTGVNDAPAATAVGLTVAENSAGAAVATLTVTDADGSAFQFRVLDAFGAVDDRFEVVAGGAPGAFSVMLKAGASLDYEAGAAIDRVVEVIDEAGAASLTGTAGFTIRVADVDETGGGSGPTTPDPDAGQGPTQGNIVGTPGNDRLVSGIGNDDIRDSGGGRDVVVYSANRADYKVVVGADGLPSAVSGPDGLDTLAGIERLAFKDGILVFDTDSSTDMLFRLYDTAFNRTPDKGGIAFNHDALENGARDAHGMAEFFVQSDEFKSLYGSAVTSSDFVTLLYKNVFDRVPDQAGLAFWIDRIDTAHLSRGEVLLGFSQSAEEVALMGPVIAQGVFFDSAFAG